MNEIVPQYASGLDSKYKATSVRSRPIPKLHLQGCVDPFYPEILKGCCNFQLRFDSITYTYIYRLYNEVDDGYR